jgi:hypothetical protein
VTRNMSLATHGREEAWLPSMEYEDAQVFATVRASLEQRDVKRNLLRSCARAAGKLAEWRSSEEAIREYQSLGWKGPCLMNPNRVSRAHAPGENPAHPLLNESAPRSLPNQYAELKRLIKQRGL